MVVAEAVVVALITGGASVVGQVIISNRSAKTSQAIFDFRLGTIETKVDKHNNFMERLAVIETISATSARDINEIKERCVRHEEFFGK